MAANEKILNSIKSARTHMESLVQALNNKDESSFDNNLWHLGTELEYALFLFSLTFQDESCNSPSKRKPNPELKKAETAPTLVEAQNLLNEANKCMTNGELFKAYRSAYAARHYVLKVQEDLAKKKREALKRNRV